MHDLCALAQQVAQSVGTTDEDTEGEEDEQMGVGEEIDELADGIVGGYGCQQL